MPTLHWTGKEKVTGHHQDVPFRVLEHSYAFFAEKGEHKEESRSGNMIIHGDNLDALKSLLPCYEGKIKCVYIDPPYNTGNESWMYNDNVNHPKIRKWLGQVVGKEGDDLSRHDKWLCMMYPRLKLLHRLLADDGAIFISIDDNEQANLRLICDEIFGNANFRNIIIIKRGTKSVQAQFETVDKLGIACEFLMVYTKNSTLRFPQFYFDLQETREGTWNNHWRGTDRPTMRYELFGITPEKGQWRWSRERSFEAVRNYRLLLADLNREEHSVTQKEIDDWYLAKTKESEKKIDLLRISKRGKPEHYVPPSDTKVGHNLWTDLMVNGTGEYSRYLETGFSNPKNPQLVKRIVNWFCNQDDIILDSFAGSGTTAHAVLDLNRQDGGNRKFILIEMEDYAQSITAERVKRVITGYGQDRKAVKGTGGAFDYYELGQPVFSDHGQITIMGQIR